MVDHFLVEAGKLGGGGHPERGGALAEQLAGLRLLGYGAVLTLTQQPLDPAALAAAGLTGLHLPIVNSAAPTRGQVDQAVQFVSGCNRRNKAVFVHCFAGYGRTGVVLAAILIGNGNTVADAVARVRNLRPGSIESAAQMEFLVSLAAS